MLTGLDRGESQMFFSRSRSKFLEVKYCHNRLCAANDAKCVIAWPWRLDDKLGVERLL